MYLSFPHNFNVNFCIPDSIPACPLAWCNPTFFYDYECLIYIIGMVFEAFFKMAQKNRMFLQLYITMKFDPIILLQTFLLSLYTLMIEI